jgi:putative aldouronate transport system substrate-binding protein
MPQAPQKRYVISKNSKNPEAAFRLADFMCSEEVSIWNRFGMPERDYRLPRPGEKSMYDSIGMPARLAQILPWGAVQNSHWGNGAAGILPMGILDGQVAPDNPLDNERWIAAAVPLYMNLVPPAANRVDFTMYTFDEMNELADMKNTINTYVNESLALFCTGQKSIERDWDSYLAELNRMNIRRYIELTQSGYDRAIGKKR